MMHRGSINGSDMPSALGLVPLSPGPAFESGMLTPPRAKKGLPCRALPHHAEIEKTCGAQWGKADCKFQMQMQIPALNELIQN